MKSLQSLGKLTSKLNPLGNQASVGLKALPTKEQMTPEEQGEKKFLKKTKYYVTEGPHLYISKLLNQKGPLNKNQIWFEYQRDTEAVNKKVISSKTYLKERILTNMVKTGKLVQLGFDKVNEQDLGYQLNPVKAFSNVHPDILLHLKPQPKIPRMSSNDVVYRKNILESEKKETQQ